MSTTDLPGPSLLAGRYRLVERLGSGGMSVVWRGFDEVLGRQIAVKVLPPSVSADPSFRRRLRAEAQAAARLSHPHITNVYDYGEAVTSGGEPVPFVVMEMVDGESLANVLARMHELPWAEAIRICAQVSAALAAAHARGIVHRDVTPANVMLTPSGAKVVDFGISALIGENDIDPDGSLLGTPAYLAPERLEGGQVSPASDVYAVGLLIYRALIGQLPWDVGTTTALLRAHQYTEPEPLPPVEGMPVVVNEMVARCLAKSPGARPTSAELAAVLTEVCANASAAHTPAWVDYGEDTTILPSHAEFRRGTREGVRAAVAVPSLPVPDPTPALPSPRAEFVPAGALAAAGLYDAAGPYEYDAPHPYDAVGPYDGSFDDDHEDGPPILRPAEPLGAPGDPGPIPAAQSPYGAPPVAPINGGPRNTRFRPAPRDAAARDGAPRDWSSDGSPGDWPAMDRPMVDRLPTAQPGPIHSGPAYTGPSHSGPAHSGPPVRTDAAGSTTDSADDPARRVPPVARIRPPAGATRSGVQDQQPFVPTQRASRPAARGAGPHDLTAAGAALRSTRRPMDAAALTRGRRLSIVLGTMLAVGVSGYGWTVLSDSGKSGAQAAPHEAGAPLPRHCVVTYGIRSQHDTSFVAAMTLTNRSPVRIEDWVLKFILPGDQTITGGGGGVLSQQGRDVTVTSDGVIKPDRTVVLSLAGTYRTDNRVPVAFELQGATCDVYVSSAPGETPKQVTKTPGGDVRLVAAPPGTPVPGLSSGPAGYVPGGPGASTIPSISPTPRSVPGSGASGGASSSPPPEASPKPPKPPAGIPSAPGSPPVDASPPSLPPSPTATSPAPSPSASSVGVVPPPQDTEPPDD